MKQIIEKIVLPSYIPSLQRTQFENWKISQMKYYTESYQLRNYPAFMNDTRSGQREREAATLADTIARAEAGRALAATNALAATILSLCTYSDYGASFSVEQATEDATIDVTSVPFVEDILEAAMESNRCFYIHLGWCY